MKKLVIIFAIFGLMFQVAGCNGKKAQDDTEVVENADVEKVEAEDANFAGNEATVEAGPVDESLQAALGEAPQVDDVATAPSTDGSDLTATTDSVNTELNGTDVAAAPAPSVDEMSLESSPPPAEVAANSAVDSGITETPVIETPAESPSQDLALTDPSLSPEVPAVAATESTPVDNSTSFDAPITETPVATATTENTFVPSETTVTAEASSQSSAASVSTTAANSKGLRKIAETTPYKHGEGYVNTVYIARPKEKLKAISESIYGMDKTKELKSINSFVKNREPKAGEKIYYVSPNRPADANQTLSYYEDTGMIASTYVTQAGDSLPKVSKKLLGYENAWKEIWTTNSVQSKGKLAAGETLRYWKPVDQPTTLAQNGGNSQLVDSAQQLPAQAMPPQEVAMNAASPVQQEIPPPPAQELPPPPPPPDMNAAAPPPPDINGANPPPDMNAASPTQELAPPPPPPQEVAAVPPPPAQKAHNMEEEPVMEEGAMSQDTTMMLGVVVVLVAILGMVLVRRNKKKREAEMSSIEQTHVGS